MKNKNHNLVLLIAFLLPIACSFSSNLINLGDSSGKSLSYNDPTLKRAGYWDINPICIVDNDPTRNWAITEATYEWCTGSGTIEDPYIIENVIIDMQGLDSGIRIIYSSTHFIIRNCVIYNTGAEVSMNHGIRLYYADNGMIINNTLFGIKAYPINVIHTQNNIISNNTISNDKGEAIVLEYSKECIISGNTINDIYKRGGIKVITCDDIIIRDNVVSNVGYWGISIYNTNYTIVEGNIMSDAVLGGIYVNRMCYFNTIQDNHISNCGTGIRIFESQSNTIKKNIVVNNNDYGILLDSFLGIYGYAANNQITENIIKENLGIGIYVDETSFSNLIYLNNFINNGIQAEDNGTNNRWDNGEIGNYWSNYTGVDADDDGIGDTPYLIPGTAGSVDNFPIWDDGFIVLPFTIWGNMEWANLAASKPWCSGSGTQIDPYIIDGIFIDGRGYSNCLVIKYTSVYFVIKNCIMSHGGIRLTSVRNGLIENNSISHNSILYGFDGIFIDRYSKDNIINGNEIFSNHHGIMCYGDNNVISQNILRDNQYGARFYWADNSLFTENIISNSISSGALFYYGAYNVITKNTFINNVAPPHAYAGSGLGMVYETADNIVYQNIFIGNLGANAKDLTGDNLWDNGSIGNYWDDYPGADLDGDGIGDLPYLTTSYYGSCDNFPVCESNTISPPEEFLEFTLKYLEFVYHYRAWIPEIGEEAEQPLQQSIRFLIQAKEKFELSMVYDAFNKIRESMEFLMIAGDMGVNTQEVIDSIMFLVQFIVDNALENTLDIVGEDNKFIIRAECYYDNALQMMAMERYDDVVKFFKLSFRNIMKARGELIAESFVDDLLDRLNEIQELKEDNIPSEALNYLNQAENKLMLAIEKANSSLLVQSLYQLKDAVNNLLDTAKFGVDTTDIIDSILENADDVTYLKIVEAESILLGESNRHLDKAWINYYKAIDLWNEGKHEFALSYYAKAIAKVEDALP